MASGAWAADEAADRAAIEKVISTLNSVPGSPGLFTEDFGDGAVLTSLGVYRSAAIRQDAILLGVPCQAPEVWPELGCPPQTRSGGQLTVGLPVPPAHFVIQSIRLLTPDVALIDAVNERGGAGAVRHSPVLLVLRKEGDVWKIASLRVLAPARPLVAQ
jgi:hypothetical protein